MSTVLVTGGAGFVGHAVVRLLLDRADEVVVYDNLSTAESDWDRPFALERSTGRLRFVEADILDLDRLTASMEGVDQVVHLAANTDIAGGFADPRLDLEGCIVGTWNVAEAMRRTGANRILYASSGVVYGTPATVPTPESSGPLLPASHYAAGKLAGEAILSGFAHLYGWRALAFRFGNTVGPRSNHGVVHDFVVKLLRDPRCLEILGDGRQAKPYVAVDDVAAAMLLADAAAPGPFAVYNVATEGTLSVDRVADLVATALDIDPADLERRHTGAVGGWNGDTPLVDFDTSALRALGWRPRWTAEQAVLRAATGTRLRVLARATPLVTAVERRARRESVPAS